MQRCHRLFKCARYAAPVKPRTLAAIGFNGLAIAAVLAPIFALAGPPFETDDPEPTDYRNSEVYVAGQYERDVDETSGAIPLVELNYGLFRNVQLSIDAPLSFVRENGASDYGLGDVTVGLKMRFIQETAHRPQIAFYPIIVLPSGNTRLREFASRFFLPLWVQKSFGHWTVYGGGGVWTQSGGAESNWWFTGLVAQYQLANGSTLGAEVIHSTPQNRGTGSETGFNLGYIAPVGKTHDFLFSFGRGVVGPRTFAAYAAYRIQVAP